MLWDTATGQELKRLNGHRDSESEHREISSLAFDPDGRLFASGSWDNTIHLWNATTGARLKTFTGHESFVNSIAFNPNGRRLASGSQDETIRLWDIATGAHVKNAYRTHKYYL